ncbi:MAG: hypothetical protein GY835_10980 [bacterium]|nr:hypothetical protein [bacterium]
MSIKSKSKKQFAPVAMTHQSIFLGMVSSQIASDMSKLLPIPLEVKSCKMLEKGYLKLQRHFELKATRFEGICDDPAAQGDFTFYLDPDATWYIPSALLLRPFAEAEKRLRYGRLDEIHMDALLEVCNHLTASFKKSVLKIRGCKNFRESEIECDRFLLAKLNKEDDYIKAVFIIQGRKVMILIKVSPDFLDLIEAN